MGLFGSKKTKAEILLVDDETEILKVMKDVLEMNDYAVRTAVDGEKALAEFQKKKPHLVLTDIRMPVMAGDRLVHSIREEDKLIPIIVMSGYSDFSKEEIQGWGANRFHPKPGNFPLLISNIEELTTRYIAATQQEPAKA